MGDAAPLLSVIVVVGALRERASACLRSILTQDVADRIEVLLVDCAPAGLPVVAGSRHPAVTHIKAPPETTFARARATGVRLARAPVVAFLEEHCRVHAGWASALIRAHRGPWVTVGAEVHNGNPGVGRSDIIGLLSYGLFYPPLRRGDATIVAGHNSSYKREVLLRYDGELEQLLATDMVLLARLQADGFRFATEPDAKLDHVNETRFASIARGYFLFNRCYGHNRASQFRWSVARRAAYVLLTPVIPLYFMAHFSLFLARHRRAFLGVFLRNAALVYAAQLFAAAGQAVGLLLGLGDAERRFTAYELTEAREISTTPGAS
jgi:glycosyltransferase involved in cell wall biosynthesis